MFAAATVSILVVMLLALVRALRGPTVFDRILAVNMFGTKTVLFIAVFGFLAGRPEFLDIALVYALINFVGVVVALRFVEQEADEAGAGASGRAGIEGDSGGSAASDSAGTSKLGSGS